MRSLIALALLVLAGCADGGERPPQAAATTTTTSTTLADPAQAACPEHVNQLDVTKKRVEVGLEELTLSRDPRVVEAAREVERIIQDRQLDPDPIPPDIDVEYGRAELELARACEVAGFLPDNPVGG